MFLRLVFDSSVQNSEVDHYSLLSLFSTFYKMLRFLFAYFHLCIFGMRVDGGVEHPALNSALKTASLFKSCGPVFPNGYWLPGE